MLSTRLIRESAAWYMAGVLCSIVGKTRPLKRLTVPAISSEAAAAAAAAAATAAKVAAAAAAAATAAKVAAAAAAAAAAARTAAETVAVHSYMKHATRQKMDEQIC